MMTTRSVTENYIKIAERYFQKKCLPDEVVHHIDGDRTNNDPENLVIMKRSQHSRLHGGLMGALDSWRQHVNNGLCNTCLFVRLFESQRVASLSAIDRDLSSLMLSVWMSSEAKPIPVDMDAKKILSSLYWDGVAWKEQNKHDCYKMRNMQVVHGGAA